MMVDAEGGLEGSLWALQKVAKANPPSPQN
jgi:hypothetical protein